MKALIKALAAAGYDDAALFVFWFVIILGGGVIIIGTIHEVFSWWRRRQASANVVTAEDAAPASPNVVFQTTQTPPLHYQVWGREGEFTESELAPLIASGELALRDKVRHAGLRKDLWLQVRILPHLYKYAPGEEERAAIVLKIEEGILERNAQR
jgi:hypothetical protein